MVNVVGGSKWSIELPENWEAQDDTDCCSFVRDNGLGALQISAASKNDTVTDQDLREFAEDHLREGADVEETRLGDFRGFEICYQDGDSAWRIWFLRSGSLALFITYNCDVDDEGIEDDEVRALLVTLKRR